MILLHSIDHQEVITGIMTKALFFWTELAEIHLDKFTPVQFAQIQFSSHKFSSVQTNSVQLVSPLTV